MSEKPHRFQRLEHFPLLSVFKRPRIELKRFERLEVDGHKIKIKITEEKKDYKKYKLCPKCLRTNSKEALYCLYCSYVFEDIAKEVEGAPTKHWEIKCPGCGKVGNRNQKYCLYCGWRLARWEEEEIPPWENNGKGQDLLSQGEVITLTIDGKTCRSTDNIIPLDVKELMLKIKKDGYSKDMVDEWVKNKNIEREIFQDKSRRSLQETIETLRFEILRRAGFIIGGAVIIYLLYRAGLLRILFFG